VSKNRFINPVLIVFLILGAFTLAVNPISADEIYPTEGHLLWKGINWNIVRGPTENTWIDDQGRLHMVLQKINGDWKDIEFNSPATYRYGKYIWKVYSGSLNYPLGTSVAMYTYTDDNHELDIEIEQYPGYDQHLWYTVQPGGVDEHPENINYSVPSNSPYLNERSITYTIDWEPTYVTFSAVTSSGTVISSWKYTNSKSVPDVPATIIFGIGKSGGGIPAGNIPQEIIWDSFQYINNQ
jgi:hypothetical protein